MCNAGHSGRSENRYCIKKGSRCGRRGLICLLGQDISLSVFVRRGGGIPVHLADLHHGAAGHGGRTRPLGAPAQLDRVVHHNIPLEQDGGGHERVALSTETHGAQSAYFMQGWGGEEGRAKG